MSYARSIVLVVFAVILSACAGRATDPEAQMKRIDADFRFVNKLTCSIRNKENDEFCSCQVDVLSEVTPDGLKRKLVRGRASSAQYELAEIMVENSDRLEACKANYSSKSLLKAEPESNALHQVLIKYKDKILAPGDEQEFDHSHLSLGHRYILQNQIADTEGKLSVPLNATLTKIEGAAFYYSVYVGEEDKTYENVIAWKNGVLYRVGKGGDLIPYYSDSACKFVIGVCEYKDYRGKSRYVNTEYINGVWVRNLKGVGSKQRLVKEVFDKDGMILYQLNKSLGKWEYVRVDEANLSLSEK
ncbi:hypothetical protein [Marinomonas mediterranea]|uniref:Lipoprotein n=1 Tax=Marinomonas mediterranea (strain ATCC 700492 / JCM 21426 / NBRC 103028 / MMB-1) TaxID=717774 RepID=F2JY78_MARM1|nr:hypothetical protein [Marinomonas mediterranea]ADZ90814.1 hypothetical protein Marme_1549 [Marinomonas mediterranea MMB-1]WCN16966.1 hypothetical protein GV053_07785 [Marinomonas mediterranea MMB-1]